MNGDVQPKSVIAGPQALGIYSVTANCRVSPGPGWILCPVIGPIGRGEVEPKGAFIGVWSINDKGDAPPRWKIEGPNAVTKRPRGITLNPKNREVTIVDMRLNAVMTYSFPEIF